MQRTRRPAHLIALLSALLVVAFAPALRADEPKHDAKSYPIKFVRPTKPGDRYRYTADGALLQKAKSTVAGQRGGESEGGFGVHLEGTVEVLEVSKTGEEAKVTCTVTKCVRQTAEGDGELIPAGRVVTATAGADKTTFSLDQGTLSDEARDALDLVLRLSDDDGFTDDDMYGPGEPKRVGDTWPLHADAVAKGAEHQHVKIDPADVSGTLKLEGVQTVNGVECQKIAGTIKVKRLVATSTENLPAGVKVADGSMEGRFSGFFPTDLSKGSVAESMSMVMNTTLKRDAGREGPEMTIETTTRRAVEVKRDFLEPVTKKDEAGRKERD